MHPTIFARFEPYVAAVQPAARPMKLVLIVDDHEDSRAITRIMIERDGYEVAEAATGVAALRLARELQPAVILLDMRLPDIDGWTIAGALREDVMTSSAAIIGFSACARPIDSERALAAGCDTYLTKPMSPRALLQVIRAYLEPGWGVPMIVGQDASASPERGRISRRALHIA